MKNWKACTFAAALSLTPTATFAAPAWAPDSKALRWADGAQITLETFDCKREGHSGIVIQGSVTLVHPNASDESAQMIRIICPFVAFQEGAQVLSKEFVNIKVLNQISGPVRLVSIRGEPGEAATPSPEIWAISKKPKSDTGTTGYNGGNARTDLKGDWSAEPGGDGGRGIAGLRGDNGATGNPGRAGKNASSLQLRAADFADGSTVTMLAVGGKGGKGGKGGRGEDGGDGGTGGAGGKGGNGNCCHSGKSGGNGGAGGDGGDGGDGGAGGVGGPGGNGADIFLIMQEGAQAPADFELSALGGAGGDGGEGGDFGMGGSGGHGGEAGCGGSGGRFIWKTGGGSCGTDGVKGADGRPGKKGPPGAHGADGRPGNVMRLEVKYVPPSAF